MKEQQKIETTQYIKRFEQLIASRNQVESWWDDVEKYVSANSTREQGQLDDTAPQCNSQFAANINSVLTNSTTNWMNLEPSYELQDDMRVTNFVKSVEGLVWSILRSGSSNFQNRLAELYKNLGLYGTAIMYMEEADVEESTDKNKKNTNRLVRFYTVPTRECYIVENQYERVQSVYRKFKLNPLNCVKRWGEECSEATQIAAEKNPYDTKIEILHIIEPINLGDINTQYRSMYIELEKKIELESNDSLEYFPYLIPRWDKETGSEYGISPAKSAIGAVIALNKLSGLYIDACDKAVNPPVLLPTDSVMGNINLKAGAVNKYNSLAKPDGIRFLVNPSEMQTPYQHMLEYKGTISRAFFLDVLTLQKEDIQMTATESNHRYQEQMRKLAPLISRFETEFLDPLVNNILIILEKWKKIPKGQVDYKIEFVSPVTHVHNVYEISNIEKSWMFIKDAAQVDRTILDHVNLSAMVKRYVNTLHIQANILLDDNEAKKVTEEREAKEQAMLEQQQQQAMMEKMNPMMSPPPEEDE